MVLVLCGKLLENGVLWEAAPTVKFPRALLFFISQHSVENTSRTESVLKPAEAKEYGSLQGMKNDIDSLRS